MRKTRPWLLGLGLLIATNAPHDQAHAQAKGPKPAETAIEDLLPEANDPNDPIGLDAEQRSLGAEPKPKATLPGRDAADSQRFGPEPPPMAARAGEVLSATPAVRESAHRARVELSQGLGLVHVELVLESSAEKPAEALYRLAVPADAALGALEVCREKACRSGLPDAADGGTLSIYDDALQARGPAPAASMLPIAHARMTQDARGTAVLLRAAPVMLGKPLIVRVTYVVAAPAHGGVVRLRLPARGMDPRAAVLELTLQAPELRDARIGELPASSEAARIDPWAAVDLSASLRGDAKLDAQLARFECGSHSCMRAYAAAPPTAAQAPVDMVLAIDASPSMEGPARSRLLTTLAAILARAPRGSQVRALMFAASAQPLVAAARDPNALPLSAFTQASFDAELGSATRFEAAWELISSWGWSKAGLRKLVVVVGDGGLTTGPARPFEQARRAGVEVSVVNMADRSASTALSRGAALTRGTLIEAGQRADDAARGLGAAPLEESISALFARTVIARVAANGGARRSELPALRAGESLSFEAKLDGAAQASLTLDGRKLRATRPSAAELGDALGVRAAALHGLREPRAALAAVDAHDRKRTLGERPAGQDQPSKRGVFCDRRGPAFQKGGLSLEPTPVALAYERARCALPVEKPKPAEASSDIGVGMPGSPLLSMLRLRIVPVARGCFRRDRAGRPDYQVRATFVDTLAVPRFSGLVIVRYPLVTEREALPSQIELTTSTAHTLDAVIEDPSRPDREVGQNKSLSLDGLDPHLHTPPSHTR